MSVEDPFFVVKDEVQKAVENSKNLYQRWSELNISGVGRHSSKEEIDWTCNELRNSLRSIEWDLEDLEETISIVEKNPKKFRIDDVELKDRKNFVERTKNVVKDMKEHVSNPNSRNVPKNDENTVRQSLLNNGPNRPQNKYTKLENEVERVNDKYIEQQHSQQQLIIKSQDEEIDRITTGVSALKNVSRQIGGELDEQAVMLDDFHRDLDRTESRMDNVMKKMSKVLHMSNDKRQWCAIGILLIVMIIVIVLFFVL